MRESARAKPDEIVLRPAKEVHADADNGRTVLSGRSAISRRRLDFVKIDGPDRRHPFLGRRRGRHWRGPFVTHWLETTSPWFFSELFTWIGFLLALVPDGRPAAPATFTQQHHCVATGHPAAAECRRATLHHLRRPARLCRLARLKKPIYKTGGAPAGGDRDGAVERLLASYGVPPPSTDNCLELVPPGIDTYCAASSA